MVAMAIQQSFKPEADRGNLAAQRVDSPRTDSAQMLTLLNPLRTSSLREGESGVNFRASELDQAVRRVTGGHIDSDKLQLATTYMPPGVEPARKGDFATELKGLQATAKGNRISEVMPSANALDTAIRISNGNSMGIAEAHRIGIQVASALDIGIVQQLKESLDQRLLSGVATSRATTRAAELASPTLGHVHGRIKAFSPLIAESTEQPQINSRREHKQIAVAME